jgi:hypothetical protein
MLMNRKAIISLIVGFVVCLLLIVFVFLKTNERDILETNIGNSEFVSLEEFLGFAESRKAFRMKIYYMSFYADAAQPYTEEMLLSGSSCSGPNLTVCVGPFTSFSYTSHLVKTFSNFTMQKTDKMVFDIRYCCVVYVEPDRCIRFSIARSSFDAICINGQSYSASPEIIEALLKFLPVINYEDANKFIEQ